MGWLFYILLLVCCFSVRADEAQSEGKLSQPKVAKNCQDVYAYGGRVSGVYDIYPDGQKVLVFCEQVLQGGGWTVFQRRKDGTIDFYAGWEYHKRGFGCAAGEYWIGNDHLHQLTSNQDTKMLVELEINGLTAYASYDEFWTGNETTNYTLHIGGFSNGQNNPGNSMIHLNGMAFSTYDRDSDTWPKGNCAKMHHGAWWHWRCSYCNPNGRYKTKSYVESLSWSTWKGWYSLSAIRMMVKTK